MKVIPATEANSINQSVIRNIFSLINTHSYQESQERIHRFLGRQGINFENRELPVSLNPTIVPSQDLARATRAGLLIYNSLEKIIERFVEEHLAQNWEGPWHRAYLPYQTWWDIIAYEQRSSSAINLMRYDAILDADSKWSFLETNTSCPGGVIHCGRIRQAWLTTQLAHHMTQDFHLMDFDIDSVAGFLKHVYSIAKKISKANHPIIAIGNYKGIYKNELRTLVNEYERLVNVGVFPGGKIILCDIRDVQCEGSQAYVNGERIHLIYNKIDQMMIHPDDCELKGWIQASRSHDVEYLNSLGAMYLTEAKRVLAILRDPNYQDLLQLDSETRQAIQEYIPETQLLHAVSGMSTAQCNWVEETISQNRAAYVLKADSLTRGEGIFLGSEMSAMEWQQALESTKNNAGVLQKRVDIPWRYNVTMETPDKLTPYREYYGIDLFYFGPVFAGAVSRSHTNPVFNVGNGGKEVPTLIVA